MIYSGPAHGGPLDGRILTSVSQFYTHTDHQPSSAPKTTTYRYHERAWYVCPSR
jgi:hypothetical protein